ncbi:hypothetical protein KO507_11065 [Gilvimarinus agarilyticus]|uniref:hypothetical protein n=1 Tax=unclassified Gilvimarinus TaxID=2642066 RepID=UPI001C095B71|nr:MULTISPECIES: hypothetical protein [unclassified Gilvimarinus]MBU2886304.1 hypothetical protein [Gilvimarinus agarilyticus]MDO6570990.1 hypothetical protein [Gilvimarinus sp. 2_MG-2023]MDO6747845.1 hypothetical protein [Gilvimarinus sp. 1_MG-2023]
MIQSASSYNLYALQGATLRPTEAVSEPGRVNPAERSSRPVNQVESPRRDNNDNRRSVERLDEGTQTGEVSQLDPLIELFIERADQNGQNREQASRDNQAGDFIAAAEPTTVGAGPSGSGGASTLGFSDLRSALSFWESLNPEREDTSSLPAPIAAYREVQSGPAPRLGLSAYA